MSDIFIQGETLQIGKKVDYVEIQGVNETIESLSPKIVNVLSEGENIPIISYNIPKVIFISAEIT